MPSASAPDVTLRSTTSVISPVCPSQRSSGAGDESAGTNRTAAAAPRTTASRRPERGRGRLGAEEIRGGARRVVARHVEEHGADRRHARAAGDEYDLAAGVAQAELAMRAVDRDPIADRDVPVDVRRADAVGHQPDLQLDRLPVGGIEAIE